MSIYQTVTDRILKQLEHGVIPCRKTWTTGLPKSLTTHRDYRGVNILVLAAAEFTSRYWVTYREAQRLGGYVRRGERATPVVYWKWRTPEELARIALKTGSEEPAPCVPFVAAVFNLDQVEGIARPADDVPSRGDRGWTRPSAWLPRCPPGRKSCTAPPWNQRTTEEPTRSPCPAPDSSSARGGTTCHPVP